MARLLLLTCLLLLPALAQAEPAVTEALDRMVRVGVISADTAQREKLQATSPAHAARGLAQRDLASVHPDLKPSRVRRMEAEPMTLFFD